ncbi:MAG: hypothetical protein RIC35_24700 [Marinoscillum sp.]
MSKQFVQNKFEAGDTVFAKVNPTQKLIIRRYIDQVYYCRIPDKPDARELVYYERELVESTQHTDIIK